MAALCAFVPKNVYAREMSHFYCAELFLQARRLAISAQVKVPRDSGGGGPPFLSNVM